MRPSCGFRRSAMSSFASTFRRVVTPAAIFFGIRCTSRSTPSTRNRTTSASSCASKWTSDAFSSAAWKMSALTSRTSGPSEIPSSASRSSPSSSLASSRSTATTEPIASAVRDEPLQLGEDVVARRDDELERVLRGQAELVDGVQVPGIGDRDPQDVALELVRDRDRALERLHRDQLRRVDGDADAPGGRRPEGGGARRACAAMPSEVATPSSISACVSGAPSAVRPRTSASASGATSAVCSRRSSRSSAVSSAPNGVASERPGATAAPADSAALLGTRCASDTHGGSLEGVIGSGRARA